MRKLTKKEWIRITKRIYLERRAGWPRTEMMRYYDSGMSPLQAMEEAMRIRPRKIAAPNAQVTGASPALMAKRPVD